VFYGGRDFESLLGAVSMSSDSLGQKLRL
jgi:hypothetical protein